jgi:hypothetical protein
MPGFSVFNADAGAAFRVETQQRAIQRVVSEQLTVRRFWHLFPIRGITPKA